MKHISYTLALVFLLLTTNAFADCTHSGSTYGEGERVGPYICQGGQWVRK
jgi:hypothetical protein